MKLRNAVRTYRHTLVYAGKETTKYPYRHYFRAKWQQLAAKGSEMALKRPQKPPEGTYLCIRAAGKRTRRLQIRTK